MTAHFFKHRKMNQGKLLDYGFLRKDNNYTYSTAIVDDQFTMLVTVQKDGTVTAQVIDVASAEEYVLHRTPDASGAFVGRVRAEYEAVLEQIAQTCFEPDVFKSEDARSVITYIREKYEAAPEFLWQKFPDNAIFRRKDTNKWYAALLTISKRKLGLDADEPVEILDLRIQPEALATLIDNETYFPGYHMNKKHWFTICMDGSVPMEEIYVRIDQSYELAE